jgi:hypothetical protein
MPASPYRGLEPFDERDAPFFFGRDRETRLISASLFAAPLTLLYGASGVGKSSVLRAGVLPRLRTRSDVLPVVFPRVAVEKGESMVVSGWQSDPLGGIKEATALALFASAGEDHGALRKYRDAVLKWEKAPLSRFMAACHEVSGRRLMVFLDQFEEYSLYHPEDDPFAEQFPEAIAPGDLSVSFLVSLREDGLAKLDRFKGRIPSLWDSYRRVDYLDPAAAEEAIRLPLGEYNRRQPAGARPIEIEDALVEAVLKEIQTETVEFEATGTGAVGDPTAQGRIDTPYLQLVMMRLWEREQAEGSSKLRRSTLQSEGGAATIVRTHLDRVMTQFTPEEQDLAVRVFHRLVTPSGAKIAISVRDLAEYETVDADRLASILRRLEEGSRRILRRVATRSDVREEPRYEIFHDRLGRAILSWRTKRLAEQAREKQQQQQVKQVRLEEDARARTLKHLDAAMEDLDGKDQALWDQIVGHLVAADGRRMSRSAEELAKHLQQPVAAVEALMKRLVKAGILRQYSEGLYDVASSGLAITSLLWSARHMSSQEVVLTYSDDAPATPSRPFPFKSVRQRLYKGLVVPFLGSGASFSAVRRGKRSSLPSYDQLKGRIAQECHFPQHELESSALSEVASFHVARLGRPALDALLHEVLGRKEHAPSETHRFLAKVAKSVPLLILSTNYDTLMEQALEDAKVPYDQLAYVRGKEGGAHLEPSIPKPLRAVVVRLNGPRIEGKRVTGSYVVTEEDQIDWIAWLNGPEALPNWVEYTLRRAHLLSLGHSARDWTQRALLRYLRDERRTGRGASAVALNPAPLSVMTWQRYEVDVYNMDLNDWAVRMREAEQKG